MATPKTILQTALAGGAAERTLLAPLVCAAAGEVEGLTPRAMLRNPTKLANTLRDLQRGLALDIVVPESGSYIELEALGVTLNWDSYPPRIITPLRSASPPPDLERRGRLPMLSDTLTRLKTVLGERAVTGVALGGPQRLVAASGGNITLSAAAELVLATVRLVCSKGVDLIWLMEESADPPGDFSEWLMVTAPIWGTIRFYQAVPALHLPGRADGWLPVVEELGNNAVTCIDPEMAPNLAAQVSSTGLYGAIIVPGKIKPTPTLLQFLNSPGCLLLTSDADWAGRVPAREFGNTAELIKGLLGQS